MGAEPVTRSTPRYRCVLRSRSGRGSTIRLANPKRNPPPLYPSTTNPSTIPEVLTIIRKCLYSVGTSTESSSNLPVELQYCSVPNSSLRHPRHPPAKSTSSRKSSGVEQTFSEPTPATRSLDFMEKPVERKWGMLALDPNLHKFAHSL
ncbi:unnamed protein product [Bursaphelenchus xylophilus]|uniref:(pine wood nematode) hypothetical protein n=1 Tax=Bursaphelenchus xylophilus TaxID=6326 RepID=A0A1I7RJX0_BURXY|nr:unnamed protein product [Bursaphelenchus xylophilus]CAG9129125.1 unnamed protein product [Bursaphelenchus xylophilus]